MPAELVGHARRPAGRPVTTWGGLT